VLEVVGVFPHVDPIDGSAAGHQGGVLVREGFNEKFAIFAATEPSPAASEDTHRAFGHFILPLFIAAKGIVDLFSQFTFGFLAGVGEGFPEGGVVGVAACVVTDGGADLGGNGIQVS